MANLYEIENKHNIFLSSFMDDKWFRSNKWDENEQKFFFEKLNNAKSDFNKAQYLRIKAYVLFKTRKKKLVLVSVYLLNIAVEKYPVRIELAPCYLQLAESYAFLGNHDKADELFIKCLEKEKLFPNVKTPVTLVYPEWIVENNLQDKFDHALKILELGYKNGLIFPDQFFLYHGLRALILKSTTEKKKALSFADKKESGLVRHKTLGLVNKKHWLIKRLKKI